MRCFGLIGFPLSHSFSANYFAGKFEREGISDSTYQTFPIERIDLLPKLITDHDDLLGINVTIPYKQEVIPYLDSIDEIAERIGAVNTIKIIRQRSKFKLIGYNTDEYGFRASLMPLLRKSYYHALILGTGGASKAVHYVLDSLGFKITFVSRNPRNAGHIAYKDLSREIIAGAGLIVNTSPAGMYPNTDLCPPIPYEFLTSDHLLYDLIYNPSETVFMKRGRCRGTRAVNGLQMLYLQADKAWEIWNSDK